MDTKQLEKLLHITDITKKRLYFVGLLSAELPGVKPVVVGGCALEFYTMGGYATGDIDVVYPDNAKLDELLVPIGFRREGRCWVSDDFDILFEALSAELGVHESERVVQLQIDDVEVSIISVEDLIIDRLNAGVHWDSTDDLSWAKELCIAYKERLDQGYLTKRSRDEGTYDALHAVLSGDEE